MQRRPILWNRSRRFASLSLPAIWLFLALCCTQEYKDPLPKATQEGKNTFGCKINGKPWVPDGGTGFQATKPITGGFNLLGENPPIRRIWIRTRSKDRQGIHLQLNETNVGEHLLNENTQIRPYALFSKDYGMYQTGNSTYTTSSNFTGKITITKADTITGVLAGTFDFTVGNSSGTTYKITEGRFDIKSPQ
ncbi:hypothetical protein [Persicitalea sp.]|uniref:hypothetical protein n=1 Tax=Persicitalea sp. TaxID=3100273 RepID=UPI0035943AF1